MTKGPFDLTGRIALVTGCGSAQGIGFASARSLGQAGASIAITATTDRVETRAARRAGS
jgi:3-oxoacyl-[acyl-carrier protein] reductase